LTTVRVELPFREPSVKEWATAGRRLSCSRNSRKKKPREPRGFPRQAQA